MTERKTTIDPYKKTLNIAVEKMNATAEKVAAALAALTIETAERVAKKDNRDHDLLTVINQKVENIQVDITEIKTGTSAKLQNHEERLQSLEKSDGLQKWITGAGIAILGIISFMLIFHLFGIQL